MWNHIQGVDFVVLGYIALHSVRNRQSVSQQLFSAGRLQLIKSEFSFIRKYFNIRWWSEKVSQKDNDQHFRSNLVLTWKRDKPTTQLVP